MKSRRANRSMPSLYRSRCRYNLYLHHNRCRRRRYKDQLHSPVEHRSQPHKNSCLRHQRLRILRFHNLHHLRYHSLKNKSYNPHPHHTCHLHILWDYCLPHSLQSLFRIICSLSSNSIIVFRCLGIRGNTPIHIS